MVRQTISYLLVTLICLGSCKSSSTTTPPKNVEKPPKVSITIPPPKFTTIWNKDSDPYPFVGSINYSENELLIGSGVIIESNIVLTAAHVTDGKEAEDIVFITRDGDRHCVKEITYYPAPAPYFFFGWQNWADHFDIAIIELEQPTDEVPVALFDKTKDSVYKGEDLVMIGYSGGQKRYSNDGVFWYYGSLTSKPQFVVTLPIEATVWFGDSGGALITEDGKLVGIVSYMAKKDRIVYENGFSSIEYYYDWINNEVGD